jgi:hemerythrin-like domain-containing protein
MDRRYWLMAGAATLSLATVPLLARADSKPSNEEDVTPTEDLMREHGVLRRALLVYAEAAARLRSGKGDVPADALVKTANLFRQFGENYHERSLEEKHIFPAMIARGGEPAALARTLTYQHERGRQITDYVLLAARNGRIGSAEHSTLAGVLEGMVRMYQHHAAIEDTVVFPAWKKMITPAQYRELGDSFEDLEQRMFGKDGFEDAVKQMAGIEASFGLADLSTLTAPAPPNASVSR